MTNGGHPVEHEKKVQATKTKGPAKPSKPAPKPVKERR